MAILGCGELGGQRPLGIGTHPGQLGGRRLSGPRFSGRLGVPGRDVAVLRHLGLEASEIGVAAFGPRGRPHAGYVDSA